MSYVYVEPWAGSAALAYHLFRGNAPVSYMGGKRAFCKELCIRMGLSQDNPPAAVILGEIGPLACVHAAISGASGIDAHDVARMVHAHGLSMIKNGKAAGYSRVNGEGNDFTDRHGVKGHWAATTPDVSAKRLESLGGNAKVIADYMRSWPEEEPRARWTRLKAEGWASLEHNGDGRWLGPQSIEDVAAWVACASTSFRVGNPASGYNPTEGEGHPATDKHGAVRPWSMRGPDKMANTPILPCLAVWQGSADKLPLPDDLSNMVIYCDPPYAGTTKYPYGDCSRETVLSLVKEWSRRGAFVAISEAEDISGALGSGWHGVCITDQRDKGVPRTFSKQKTEWLTMNRKPDYAKTGQQSLFGRM